MVDLKNRKWNKRAKAAESINVEAKACFSERVRYIYFCLLTPISTLMLVEWKGREKAWLTMVLEVNYKFRRFKPSDLEGVIRINRACLPENYTVLFFMNLYKRFPETFIVAEANREIVGYIMCRIETGIPSFKLLGITRRGHVISIAVLPNYQQKGIGYALMREATQAMVNYNAKECYLEVRESNLPAVGLYKKLGFEIARTSRNYYANGEDAFVMAKQLPLSMK
jgi:ribosomal-protein-alanine N-acetyltransferase